MASNIRLAQDEVLETSIIAGKKILKKVKKKDKKNDFISEIESVDNIVNTDLFASVNIVTDYSALYGSIPEPTVDISADEDDDQVFDSSEVSVDSSYYSDDEDYDEDSESVEDSSDAKDKRINTKKIFDNNDFYNGGTYTDGTGRPSISISPLVEDQYDFAVAEDIVLMNDRKDTTRIIYDIFKNAPFSQVYTDVQTGIIKIPKDDIQKVFYYIKDRLLKRKKVSAFETVIAINEFFDFNYDFIVKKVISTPMMSEILSDYYNNLGMKDRIQEQSENPLF